MHGLHDLVDYHGPVHIIAGRQRVTTTLTLLVPCVHRLPNDHPRGKSSRLDPSGTHEWISMFHNVGHCHLETYEIRIVPILYGTLFGTMKYVGLLMQSPGAACPFKKK